MLQQQRNNGELGGDADLGDGCGMAKDRAALLQLLSNNAVIGGTGSNIQRRRDGVSDDSAGDSWADGPDGTDRAEALIQVGQGPQ